jgi:pseudaminic acid biosynthesis-associated methylase
MGHEFKTEQESFWAGEFGDAYIARNTGDWLVASNIALLSRILGRCHEVNSVLEFGANTGLNLKAIRALAPHAELGAIEINDTAVEHLRAWGGVQDVYHGSVLDYRPDRQWDAVLVKGVLIHLDPNYLPQVYDSVVAASKRYVILVEYYSPTPTEVPYRGHAARLFKRDFAGEMLDKHPDLRVLDYGFVWRRDPAYPQDDVTWFLLEKTGQCA